MFQDDLSGCDLQRCDIEGELMEQGTSTSGQTSTSGVLKTVRDQANAQLNSQKQRATDGIGSVAQAVRETSKGLRDNKQEGVARYVDQAADQLDRLSSTLREKDLGELVNDAQQLARRQPALFIGSAFALGLLGARFLKSSSPHDDGYGESYGSGRGSEGRYGSRGYGSEQFRNQGFGSERPYGGAGTGTSQDFGGSRDVTGSGYGTSSAGSYGTGGAGSATPGTASGDRTTGTGTSRRETL